MADHAERGEYVISTDPQRLDVDAVHAYLTQSYWFPGIPRTIVERARIMEILRTNMYRQ